MHKTIGILPTGWLRINNEELVSLIVHSFYMKDADVCEY